MEEKLRNLLEPVVAGFGLLLWGIEYIPHGRQAMLRIYIDSPDGVGIDDCERVSHQVSSVLDVERAVTSDYTLEVSSPGLERRLYELSHYKAYAGNQIRISLRQLVDGRRRFSGLLVGVEGDRVIVRIKDEDHSFAFSSIDRGQLVFAGDIGKTR